MKNIYVGEVHVSVYLHYFIILCICVNTRMCVYMKVNMIIHLLFIRLILQFSFIIIQSVRNSITHDYKIIKYQDNKLHIIMHICVS